MDFRLGSHRGRAAALVAAVTVLGLSAAPGGAFAAEVISQTSSPQIDARFNGPGFDVHRQIVGNEEHVDVNVCSKLVATNAAHCDARIRTDVKARSVRPARTAQPHDGAVGNNGAYDPGYLQSAYNVAQQSAGSGLGQVVAIVDAMDDPNAETDMGYYRSFFGLQALPTCTGSLTAAPCFKKIDQFGGTSYPAANQSWAEEISLDLDMVSAMCPKCTILLVEASSASYTDLATAVNEAAALGANVISNSYGGGEWSGESGMDDAYYHPGVAVTVSTGDAGYGVEYPAASPYVTAVGGTTLNQATNTGTRSATETAWTGAGSGCSAYENKPTWQTDAATCARRTVADVSAVADPNTGVWVYDTYVDPGWEVFGGTSVASPVVGAVYALAGNSLSSTQLLSALPYAHTSSLNDIVGGSNGSCGGTYLCTAVTGYDGPTGLGTPLGTAAFTVSTIVVPAPDFSLKAASSTLRLTRGGSNVGDMLTLSALNGYRSAVTLSISGLKTGVTGNFNANPVTPSATSKLTMHASRFAATGTFPVTVTAKGADGTAHTLTIQVTVQ